MPDAVDAAPVFFAPAWRATTDRRRSITEFTMVVVSPIGTPVNAKNQDGPRGERSTGSNLRLFSSPRTSCLRVKPALRSDKVLQSAPFSARKNSFKGR